MQSLLSYVADKEYRLIVLNNDVRKIKVADYETYRKLTMKLSVSGYQWFTYEDKNVRPNKDLHQTCESIDIIEDLESKGLKS